MLAAQRFGGLDVILWPIVRFDARIRSDSSRLARAFRVYPLEIPAAVGESRPLPKDIVRFLPI
jgi:hypothetical protein